MPTRVAALLDWFREHGLLRRIRGATSCLPREFVGDPRLISYYDHGPGRGCAMHAPCEFGVGFNAFTLGQDSYHPWFLAAQLATVQDSEDVFNFLGNYYSRVQPKTLWDWHDISPKDSPALGGLPVYGWAVLPWSPDDVQALLQKIKLAYVKENRKEGLKYGISAGAKAFGPVSDAKLRIEAERISRLAVSIQNRGLEHQRSDYNVRAVFLLSDGKWRWLTAGGTHRIPVAAGLGILQVPVRVVAVVRREEVDIWPQVESGLYSKEAALALFDRLFEGRPPRCAEPWIAWIDGSKQEFASLRGCPDFCVRGIS